MGFAAIANNALYEKWQSAGLTILKLGEYATDNMVDVIGSKIRSAELYAKRTGAPEILRNERPTMLSRGRWALGS